VEPIQGETFCSGLSLSLGYYISFYLFFFQVSQGMVGQAKARRGAGLILEMVKVKEEGAH